MTTNRTDAVFIDTTIQIGRLVHRPEIKEAIFARLKNKETVSGLVVRQELKRRLLKDALYLLKQLQERKSYQRVIRHVADSLPKQHQRKMSICLDLLLTVDENDNDYDRTDRARLMLRDIIKNGVANSEAHLHHVNKESGCFCALQPITERKAYSDYQFGTDRCSKTNGRCGVKKFLEDRWSELESILAALQSMPNVGEPGGKTAELARAEKFIESFFADPDSVTRTDPCLQVGDLLIALESLQCSTMYTMNVKESSVFTKALQQKLIYRPPNSDNPEIES